MEWKIGKQKYIAQFSHSIFVFLVMRCFWFRESIILAFAAFVKKLPNIFVEIRYCCHLHFFASKYLRQRNFKTLFNYQNHQLRTLHRTNNFTSALHIMKKGTRSIASHNLLNLQHSISSALVLNSKITSWHKPFKRYQ